MEMLHYDLRVLILPGGKTTHEDILLSHPAQFCQGQRRVLGVLQDTTCENNIEFVAPAGGVPSALQWPRGSGHSAVERGLDTHRRLGEGARRDVLRGKVLGRASWVG